MTIRVGQKIRLHDLACAGIDTSFRTENGWAVYDAIDYPNNASGWWVTVSRMTPKGCAVRRMHTDSIVVVTEIRTFNGNSVDVYDEEVREKVRAADI